MFSRHVFASILSLLLLVPKPTQALTDVIWTGGTGNWSNSALWNPTGVPNGVLFHVLLDNGNVANSIVSLDTTVTIGWLTIDAGDLLRIEEGFDLTLSNALVNNAGILSLNSLGSGAYLYIDGTTTLQGAGKVTLGSGLANTIQYSGDALTDTLINKQTIEGRGDISVLLNNHATGLIHANVANETLNIYQNVTNAGTLRASGGGTLSLTGVEVANTGGVISAQSGGTVQLGISVTGGTLSNVGGTILSGLSTTLDGSGAGITLNGDYTVGANQATVVMGTVNNNGQLAITGGGASLYISGTVNLQGTGKVTLGSGVSNTIAYNTGFDPEADTLNLSQTIEGQGFISVKINNTALGIVDANVNGEALVVDLATTNAGTLRASNGGTLSLTGVAVANTGGVISAQSGGTVQLGFNVTGGTLSNVGGNILSGISTTLDGSGVGITLNGNYTVGSNQATVVMGTVNNNGQLAVTGGGASLYISGTVNLQGTGKITIGSGAANTIAYNTVFDADADTLNSFQTIEGQGDIGVNFNNKAGQLVNANVSGQTLSITRSVTNLGTLQSSSGGTLALTSSNIANVGGTIQALAGSTLSLSNGTRIDGGTVGNFGGTMTFGASVTLDGTDAAGMTLQGTVTAPNGTAITLLNSIINTGTLALNSTGAGSTLVIGGNGTGVVNLTGGGAISMGALGSTDYIAASTVGNRLINTNNTIQGAGSIGGLNMKLTNLSLIDANRAGQTLIVNPQIGAGFGVNSGTMRASGGGTLSIQSDITNTGGLVEATAGSMVKVEGSEVTGGTVKTTGAGEIRLMSGTITGGSLLNSTTGIIRAATGVSRVNNGFDNPAGGQVIVDNAASLIVQGTLQNAGTIALNSTGSGTSLRIEGAVILQGAGKLTLGSGSNNSIVYHTGINPDADILTSYQTIEGRGDINVNFTNTAGQLVDANVSGQSIGIFRATTNAGTLRASNGGTLSFASIPVTNTGGIIQAQAGSTVDIGSSVIIGGTLSNVGGSMISGTFATLDGSGAGITINGTYTIGDNKTTVIRGTVNNGNLIALNTTGASLLIEGNVTLQGAGKVTLGNGLNNGISYRSIVNPDADTLNNLQTIEGRGAINVNLNNTASGLVNANTSGQTLDLIRNATNTGILQASSGGTLAISATSITNVGGTIQALVGSTVSLTGGQTIFGGTVRNLGSVAFGNGVTLDGDASGITLEGPLTVPNGVTLNIVNTVRNTDTITLASTGLTSSLAVAGNGTGVATLSGSGTVFMTGADATITAITAGNRLINLNNTIEGKGSIGTGTMKLTNDGLINANIAGQTLNVTPQAVAGAGINTGTLRASNGGTLRIENTINNTDGVIEATAGSFVKLQGGTLLNGTVQTIGTGEIQLLSSSILNGSLLNSSTGIIRAVSGASLINTLNNVAGGQVLINNDATLAVQGTLTNNGSIALNSTGSGNTLKIEGTVTLLGTGVVTLGTDSDNQIRYGTSAVSDVLVNPQTIQGTGLIDVQLINQATGIVSANVAGQTLGLNQNLVNVGVLRASGGVLSINSVSVLNTDGIIQAQTGSTVNLNSSTIIGGTLTNTAGFMLSGAGTFLNGATGGDITLQGTYTIGDGKITALSGTIHNTSLIALNSTGSGASLYIDGTATLRGDAGRITLGTGEFNTIRYNNAPTTDTLVSHQTIEGRGDISVLLNTTTGRLVNANVPGMVLSLNGNTTNAGTLRASNSGILSLNSISVANTGGIIQALTGSTVNLNNSTITGGIVSNIGGTVNSGFGTFLDGATGGDITLQGTYTIADGKTTALKGTVINANLIALNSTDTLAHLYIDGTVNLQGQGKVTIGSGDYNGIRFNNAPLTDTLNNSQTIEGKGVIAVQINNQPGAVINANSFGGTLLVATPLVNSGTLRAENFGALDISGGGSSTGPIDIALGAQLHFSGADFTLRNASSSITGAGTAAIISGGSVTIGDSAADTISATNLQLISGTLTGPGTLVVSNNFTWNGGTVSGSGSVTIPVGTTATFGGSTGTLDERLINNHGTINWSKEYLTAGNDSVITNTGTGIINLQDSPTLYRNGESTINNSGLLRKTTGGGTSDLYVTLNNTGTVEVQNGTLAFTGTTTNSGNLVVNNGAAASRLEFGNGTHALNSGTTITGTGQVRIATGGEVTLNTNITAPNVALDAGVIQGTGNLTIQSSFQWSSGTMSGNATTTIASDATMVIDTANTKYLDTRDLVNSGTANWTGGTLDASNGARFINDGTLVVTGDAGMSSASSSESFVNNGTLIVQPPSAAAGFAYALGESPSPAAPPAITLTLSGNIANNGTIEQRAGATINHTGDVTGNGSWNIFGAIAEWFTGLFAPKTVTGSTTVSGATGQLNMTGAGNIVAVGGGNIVAVGGGNVVANGGGNVVANGGGNVVANGGGNVIQNGLQAAIVANGGGNVVANGGGNVVANGGGNIVANGGGNIVAVGGGNVVANGGGNIVAVGGGNALASGAGSAVIANGGGNILSQGPGSSVVAVGGGNVVANGGGNIVAVGGGNVVANGGGNVVAVGGANIAADVENLSSLTAMSMSSPAPFTCPMIVAEDGGNLIGHTGGTFTGNVVAQSGGSLLPGDIGAAATMTIASGGLDLQTGSMLKMDLLGLVQGVGYDFLEVAGSVVFNGNLLVKMAYGLRTLASTDAFTLLSASSPVTGTIGNLTGDRIATADGLGSFKATYGTNNSLVLDDFQAATLTFPVWQGAWAFDSAPEMDFNADPDHDGATNGMEYALGMDPLATDADLLPIVSIIDVAGIKYLALTYVRQAGVNLPSDITFAVERSTDLRAPDGGWSTSGVTLQSAAPGPEAGFETVVMRSVTPIGTPGVPVEFLRLKVMKP
jgi:fibronectin-binding autotransporter adhesin